MPLHPDYVSVDDAAELLGVSTRTMHRWWAERVGPPRTKVGRRVYYRRSAIEDYMRLCETVPPRSVMAGQSAA